MRQNTALRKNEMKNTLFTKILLHLYQIKLSSNVKQFELVIKPNDKCLCLAPHPDDESIGCGGILSKYPKNFKVICATDGSRSSENCDKEELIQTRKKEFLEAMQIAGVEDYEMLEIPDKRLIFNLFKCKNIDISDFDYIFLPNFLDQHKDHKALSIILRDMLKSAPKLKKNLKIVFYEIWATLPVPNSFIDITDILEQKTAMINAHKSQTQKVDYAEKITGLHIYRGLSVGCKYAEAFDVMDVDYFYKLLKKL